MSKFNYIWNASGDWEGLYDDGKLVMEAHSIHPGDLAAYLGIDWYAAEVSDDNTEWGYFPASIDELVGVNLGNTSYPIRDTVEDYSDLLRELCCNLSVGGYNSEGLMPVETARAKIIDGIEFLTRPLLTRIEELKAEINRLNQIVATDKIVRKV